MAACKQCGAEVPLVSPAGYGVCPYCQEDEKARSQTWLGALWWWAFYPLALAGFFGGGLLGVLLGGEGKWFYVGSLAGGLPVLAIDRLWLQRARRGRGG